MRSSIFLSLCWAASLCGCAPAPEKVCTQVIDHEARARGASLPDADRKAALDRCVSRVSTVKDQDSGKYGCLSKCVMAAADVAAVEKCEDGCAAKGIALEPKAAVAGDSPPAAAPAGGPAPGGCRDACKRTLDSCTGGCGDDVQCGEKCHAAYVKCGTDCVH